MFENLKTLIDLFPCSIGAGLLISVVCSALGVYVILKRIVFIGAALSESAALGIAMGMVFGFPSLAGASALSVVVGLGLSRPYEQGRLPRDTVLGILFAAAGALSIRLVSKAGLGLEEVKALLYGDLILTRPPDLVACILIIMPAGVLLLAFRRPLLYTFLDREAAMLLGIRAAVWETLYFVVLALVVAASARVAGAMLVFSYLVLSPAAALLLSRRLRVVVALSMIIGAACTLAGLYAALALDLPANQLITALLALVLVVAWAFVRFQSIVSRKKRRA
jgi:ABC-type Mn2+/Zn2+ transport system permease subunit